MEAIIYKEVYLVWNVGVCLDLRYFLPLQEGVKGTGDEFIHRNFSPAQTSKEQLMIFCMKTDNQHINITFQQDCLNYVGSYVKDHFVKK